MYKKAKNFIFKGYEENHGRWMLMWWIVTIALMLVAITVFRGWRTFYQYPENVYQYLEREAMRVIAEHDLDSKCEMEIKSFSNKTNKMEFTLEAHEDQKFAKITVKVENYNQDNQKINIHRQYKNAINQVFVKTMTLILISVCLAFILGTIVWNTESFLEGKKYK